jgi:hypothetical protein
MIAALFLAAAQTAAPVSPPAACEDRLVPYGVEAGQDWSLTLAAPGGGSLDYVGAEHLRDPAHPQFAAIDAAYAAARPTVVFYEGPDRGVGADGPDTIRTRGEAAYVRFLARQGQAAVRSLEPPPAEQMKHLIGRFGGENVALFFFVREAVRIRDREGLSGKALDQAVSSLLTKASAMGLMPTGTTADLGWLDAAYARNFPGPPDWRQAKTEWFDPMREDLFTNAINRADSEFRNVWMYRQLTAAVLSGDRVFAVVGRNHVPRQAPALRCALGGTASR